MPSNTAWIREDIWPLSPQVPSTSLSSRGWWAKASVANRLRSGLEATTLTMRPTGSGQIAVPFNTYSGGRENQTTWILKDVCTKCWIGTGMGGCHILIASGTTIPAMQCTILCARRGSAVAGPATLWPIQSQPNGQTMGSWEDCWTFLVDISNIYHTYCIYHIYRSATIVSYKCNCTKFQLKTLNLKEKYAQCYRQLI